MFKDRSTTDVVVILLTTTVGLTIILAGCAIIIQRIMHPEYPGGPGLELLGNILTTIVGALVGFIGGRATGKAEANGNGKQ